MDEVRKNGGSSSLLVSQKTFKRGQPDNDVALEHHSKKPLSKQLSGNRRATRKSRQIDDPDFAATAEADDLFRSEEEATSLWTIRDPVLKRLTDFLWSTEERVNQLNPSYTLASRLKSHPKVPRRWEIMGLAIRRP